MRFKGILKEHASVWNVVLRASDIAVVLITGWLAALIYLGSLPELPEYRVSLVLSTLLCLVLFPLLRTYQARRGTPLADELRAVTLAWLATMVTLTFLAFLTKTGSDFSRGWFLIWLVLGCVFLLASRIFLRTILSKLRQRGFNTRRIVVIGTSSIVNEVILRLEQRPWLGLIVDRSLSMEITMPCDVSKKPSHDEAFDLLVDHVATNQIDQVWIAAPLSAEDGIRTVQMALRHCACDIRYVPDFSTLDLLNHSISEVAGLPIVNLTSSGMDSIARGAKALEDYLLAVLILIAASPLMVVIAIGVKFSSPGPVLFRQKRLGKGGVTIEVLKFRSMVVHSERKGVLSQATRNDSRVTRFGAFLRRTSLDELPQFINVIKGEMSIVGPRPHALEHNEYYKSLVESYMARHKIKPGITGWAQINGYRGETNTLDKMKKRVEYDIEYIENWSIWFDFKIIILTIFRGFRDPTAY